MVQHLVSFVFMCSILTLLVSFVPFGVAFTELYGFKLWFISFSKANCTFTQLTKLIQYAWLAWIASSTFFCIHLRISRSWHSNSFSSLVKRLVPDSSYNSTVSTINNWNIIITMIYDLLLILETDLYFSVL